MNEGGAHGAADRRRSGPRSGERCRRRIDESQETRLRRREAGNVSISQRVSHVWRVGVLHRDQGEEIQGRLFIFLEVGGSNGNTWDAGIIHSFARGQPSMPSLRWALVDATVHRSPGRHWSD